MKSRRWFRKLYLFYKILHSKSPSYLFNLIPEDNNPYASRSVLNTQIPFFNVKTNFSKNPFSQQLWPNEITLTSVFAILLRVILKNLILKFIRHEPNRISSTQNFEGLKLLTRMRLDLSHLADHKFRHNFQDCLNPICSCGGVARRSKRKVISFFTVSLSQLQLCKKKHFLKKLTSLIL